jgi:chitodextrinase
VAGYDVFRDGTQVANVTAGTSYADTGLSDATSYQYTVAAYDAAGNVSAQSPAVTAVTPDVTPPSVPTGLAAVAAASGHEVDLSWNASTDNVGVTGYQVFRDGTPVAEVTNGTSYADTGLTDGTSYQYTVAAYDAAGNVSAQSPAVTAVTPDVTPPSVPTGLQLALAAKSINLSWNASTDNVGVTGYAIYRNGTKIATTTSLTYSNTSVVQGKTYTYSVAAYDAAGNQSAQSAGQVMTFPDTTPPSVPTGLKLALAAKSIKLTWTASTDNVGVTGYAIYRNGTKIATTTSLTYSDTSVVQGMTYIYSVAAYDAAGNQSAQSAGQVMTFPDTTPPSVPTGLTAAPAASGTQVNLSWNASTDNVAVAGYKVFRNGTQVAEVTSGTSYADTGLTDATSYKYTVAAYDAAGNTSAQSHAVTAVTPDTTPPTQPTNLTLTPGSKSITLKWTASTDNVGVKGYYIYRGTTKIATVTATTYTDKNLTTGTTYSYYIVAFDAALNLSQPSATKSAAAK